MPIARITGQGLAAIAFCVCLLWGCVLVDRARHAAAVTERARVVREVREMQRNHRSEPASNPSPFSRRRLHVSAG
jgi:cytochrome b